MWNDLYQIPSKASGSMSSNQIFLHEPVWFSPSHLTHSGLFLSSMQRSLHQLGGDGIPDGPPGSGQSHNRDSGFSFSAGRHCRSLQGVLAGHHAHRQPAEVRPSLPTQRGHVRNLIVQQSK